MSDKTIEGDIFLVASSVREGNDYRRRFPAVLDSAIIVIAKDDRPETLQGRRVKDLYITESVNPLERVIHVLYASLVLSGHSSTRMWPTILQENWREV